MGQPCEFYLRAARAADIDARDYISLDARSVIGIHHGDATQMTDGLLRQVRESACRLMSYLENRSLAILAMHCAQEGPHQIVPVRSRAAAGWPRLAAGCPLLATFLAGSLYACPLVGLFRPHWFWYAFSLQQYTGNWPSKFLLLRRAAAPPVCPCARTSVRHCDARL